MDHPWPPIARAPAGDAEDGPGLLHTSRLTASTPHFDIVGSSAELYPPSNTRVSSQLPPARRLQEQWLLDTHPEAFMGNQIFKDYLKEEMERFGQLEETTQRRPLLAVGLMSNRGDASTPEALPVLAVATGSCGEQLRLTRMDDSQWQWGKNTEAILHLTIVTSIHKEEGAVWATDPVPISQVKAVEYTPNGSFRWLLVQKPAWTAILEPEYHPFAVLDHDAADSTHQRPSYINPNPLLTLHHQETGGNAHSDVCFNPPASERPPQLTILDECGYWTIWNVLETRTFNKKTLRLSQYMCGHIREGFLPTIPSQSAYPAMRYGLLYVGKSEPEGGSQPEGVLEPEGVPPRQARNLQATTIRPSRYMLIWNSALCEVMDLESKSTLSIPTLLFRTGPKKDQILDVRCSLLNEDHVFVLTARRLIWLDLRCRYALWDAEIVLAPLHFPIHCQDVRMSVSRASINDADTSLVFIYSSKATKLYVYWLRDVENWHRYVTQLPGCTELSSRTKVQQLHIHPATLERWPGRSAARPGSSYLRHGLNFFQVSILGEDLGVRYCICTTSTGPVSEISLPDKPIRRSGNKQQRRWTRKYNRGLRRTREPFVVPDGMETDEAGEAPQQNSGDDSSGDSADDSSGDSADEPSWEAAIREQIDVALAQGKSRVPAELFDITQRILKDGLRNGSLPLTTWAEVAEGIEQPTAYFADDAKIDESAEHLLSISDERTFVGPLRKHEPNAPLGVAALKQQLSDFWLESGGGNPSTRLERARETWVSDIARDVFLSSHGVMVQDVPFLRPSGSDARDKDKWATLSSQLPSRKLEPSSSASLSAISSASPPSAPADIPLERLKLLATSLQPLPRRSPSLKPKPSSSASLPSAPVDLPLQRLRLLASSLEPGMFEYLEPVQVVQVGEPVQTQGPRINIGQPGDRKKGKEKKRPRGFR